MLERTQGVEIRRREYTPLVRSARRGNGGSNGGGGQSSTRRNPKGSGLPRLSVSLDRDFWLYLQSDAVALPLDLLRAFRRRPKAWDLVAFVPHRCTIAKSPSVVPWPDLVEQLGTLDQSPQRLRRTLARVLDEIRVVHPRFPARFVRGGGMLVGPWGR